MYIHLSLSLSLSLVSLSPSSPGANSPIDWVEENVVSLVPELSPNLKREKTLLGLNFYGYNFTSSTMDGKNNFRPQWGTHMSLQHNNFLLLMQEKWGGMPACVHVGEFGDSFPRKFEILGILRYMSMYIWVLSDTCTPSKRIIIIQII